MRSMAFARDLRLAGYSPLHPVCMWREAFTPLSNRVGVTLRSHVTFSTQLGQGAIRRLWKASPDAELLWVGDTPGCATETESSS